MWTAQTRDIEGCLFPFSSKTVFRQTVDESMKNPHCSGACWIWKFFHQHAVVVAAYQITIHRKVPCNVRLPLPPKRNFQPALEISIAEAVIQGTEAWFWGGPSHEPGLELSLSDQMRLYVTVYFFWGGESRNRPGVAQRVPGVLDSQISWHLAHEGGGVVSLTHRPPLHPGNVSGTHFH
jgi:hypothetical protein